MNRAARPMNSPRLERERRTLEAMIRGYCRGAHGAISGGGDSGLCRDCSELLEYAWRRLERCPFQENKPTCAKCPVHCYQPERREQVRQVMRYAGPRLFWRHPVLTVRHFLDAYRKIPPVKPLEPAGRSKLDMALAKVCLNCPACRHARKTQGGAAFWLVRNVENSVCPFCRAYERVYGRKSHERLPSAGPEGSHF